ncbi:hypothetical protein M3Y99_01574500 [Aphelenchoides fujianensis]|nr:hypothetical protein M3Y99_01574500 [Aphelenchoides fujianensis]
MQLERVRRRGADEKVIYDLENPYVNLHFAYETLRIGRGRRSVAVVELNSNCDLMAVVEHDGTISVLENVEDRWARQATWKFKDLLRPKSNRRFAHHRPIVSGMRPKLTARWSLSHARLLAIGASNRARVHVFGENTQTPVTNRSDAPYRWTRVNSMPSAGNVTDIRFSPPHLEFSMVSATDDGVIVVHMLADVKRPETWTATHVIRVFAGQPISSLTWNLNPVHELPILVAATDGLTAKDGERIAVFAVNSPTVNVEMNCCFETNNVVHCVSFGPSVGLNQSFLIVAVGRRLCLYSMDVQEFHLPDGHSPSVTSDGETEEANGASETASVRSNSSAATSAAINIEGESVEVNAAHLPPVVHERVLVRARTDRPFCPPTSSTTRAATVRTRTACGRLISKNSDRDSQKDDGDSTEDEEEEQEPPDPARRALMWNVRQVAIFRERSAVRRVHWGRNPDHFTAEFVDGRMRSYKCEWGAEAGVKRA